jgi:hypothetical protein
MLSDPLAARLAAFVREIGIPVRIEELPNPTFLPGLDIRDGTLWIDGTRLLYPSDILHEAGHLAVSSAEQRARPALSPDAGDEMAAIAWSWAAACHLKLEPAVLFHPAGYKGGSAALIGAFSAGRYFGVPMLHYHGMSIEPRQAAALGLPPFPHMLRWVR